MRNGTLRVLVIACSLAALPAVAAVAQSVDGIWTITAETQAQAAPQPQGAAGPLICKWTGTWDLTDSAGTVTGMVTLNLTQGDPGCPATMSSTVSGKNAAGSLSGGIGGPSDPLGEVSFTGNVSSRAPTTIANGPFTVVGGSFTGNAGIWSGTLAPVAPTVPQLGLLLLLLALFASGSYFLLRRRPV